MCIKRNHCWYFPNHLQDFIEIKSSLTPSFFLPVWSISPTLYCPQRAAVFTTSGPKVKAFHNVTEREEGKQFFGQLIHIISCKMFTLLFTCLYLRRLRRGRTGFYLLLLNLLSLLMGLEQKVSDKWSEHWAGLAWISMVCLALQPFHRQVCSTCTESNANTLSLHGW